MVSRLVLRPTILDLLIVRPEASGEVGLGIAVGEQARSDDVRVHRLDATWVTVGEPHRYADALASVTANLYNENLTLRRKLDKRTRVVPLDAPDPSAGTFTCS